MRVEEVIPMKRIRKSLPKTMDAIQSRLGRIGTGVADREQGVAAAIASTATGVGAAVGLALLVLVANAGTADLAGEPLHIATADGLRAAVLAVAAGIAAMVGVAMTLPRAKR